MKYNYSATVNDYKTPPALYNKALQFFVIDKFNCDVCCTDENIPSVCYCKHNETDGLSEDWAYKYWFYCWCNPLFTKKILKAIIIFLAMIILTIIETHCIFKLFPQFTELSMIIAVPIGLCGGYMISSILDI